MSGTPSALPIIKNQNGCLSAKTFLYSIHLYYDLDYDLPVGFILLFYFVNYFADFYPKVLVGTLSIGSVLAEFNAMGSLVPFLNEFKILYYDVESTLPGSGANLFVVPNDVDGVFLLPYNPYLDPGSLLSRFFRINSQRL